MVLKKYIATISILLLVSASTTFACGGSVTIKNEGSLPITITSYDWDDATLSANYDRAAKVDVGSTATLSCVKSWWTCDSPGCKIIIQDWSWFTGIYGPHQVSNGDHHITGAWTNDDGAGTTHVTEDVVMHDNLD